MTKPFRYERVQKVRSIEEEQAREEFLAYERVARQAEEAADSMQVEIERAQQEFTETRLYRRVPAADLLTAQTTLESLDRSVTEQRRRARDLREEAETQRATWEGARTDAQALDRLEERHQAASREEERTTEARALDELSLRPSRGNSLGGDSTQRDPVRPPSSSSDAATDEEDPSGAQ